MGVLKLILSFPPYLMSAAGRFPFEKMSFKSFDSNTPFPLGGPSPLLPWTMSATHLFSFALQMTPLKFLLTARVGEGSGLIQVALNEEHQYTFKWFITGLPLELVYQKIV